MNFNGHNRCYLFENFELDTQRRVLSRDGVPVPLKPKAVELLIALVENRGRIVSKADLLDRVWEDHFVEEKNLSVHIAALRKSFGEAKDENRFIATVAGTGYSFVADVRDRNGNGGSAEAESYRRIVIEEEFAETSLDDSMSASEPQAKQEVSKRRITWVVVAVVLVTGLAGLGFWRYRNGGLAAASPASTASPKIRQLTTNGKVLSAAISPDGKLFAYVVSEGRHRSLWSGFVAGGKPTVLVEPSETKFGNIGFTADSTSVIFGERQPTGNRDGIYKVLASGGAIEQVIAGMQDFIPSTGKQSAIYLVRKNPDAGTESIVEHEINGGEVPIATLSLDLGTFDSTVSVSPDHRGVAAAIPDDERRFYHDLAFIDAATGAHRRVDTTLFRHISDTIWSPDGRFVYVSAVPGDSWSSYIYHQIYRVDTSTLEVTTVTNDLSSYESILSITGDGSALVKVEHRQMNNIAIANVDDLASSKLITRGSFGKFDGLWGVDFTPDGQIVFTNSDKASQVISIMNADGTNVRQLTPPGRVDSASSVTPDGRHIVFLSDRSGVIEIWRMNIDGTNARALTDIGSAFQPFLSADGQWVYYRNGTKEGRGRLDRVSINGGPSQSVTTGDTSWGSCSPDGKYIAAGITSDKPQLAVFDTTTFEKVNTFEMPPFSTVSIGTRWTPDSRSIVYRDWFDGYWVQDLADGEPKHLEGLPHEKLYNFAYSKDGKRFAFVRGQEMRDVVLIPTAR